MLAQFGLKTRYFQIHPSRLILFLSLSIFDLFILKLWILIILMKVTSSAHGNGFTICFLHCLHSEEAAI